MQAIITDRFEIRSDLPESTHAPGLVILARGDIMPAVGTLIGVALDGNEHTELKVLESEPYGDGFSLFVGEFSRHRIRVGSRIQWTLLACQTSAVPREQPLH